MTQLQFSSRPRSTWLWAPDEDTARRVRGYGRPAYRHNEELPLVTDIGVTAWDACRYLAEDDFTFTWHESEHPSNRSGWPADLPGMPPR